jgi:hypothetical protein
MLFNKTLDSTLLAQEYLNWCQSDRVLRFGQYICNKYLILGKSAPEIFYAENVGDAYWLIADVLVNQEIENVSHVS